MPNYLKMPKKSQVVALLELGWSYRRIQTETGVRRETVSRYDRTRQPNAAKTFPGSDASPPAESRDLQPGDGSNAAKTFAGSGSNPANTFPGSTPRPRFAAAAYRTAITEKRRDGPSACSTAHRARRRRWISSAAPRRSTPSPGSGAGHGCFA